MPEGQVIDGQVVEQAARPGGWLGRSAVRLVAVVVVVAIGVNTGLEASGGNSRAALVLPLAAVAGVALGFLGLLNFEVFVMAVLVARASLDAAKLAEQGTSALDPAAVLSILFMMAGLLWLAARLRARATVSRSPLRSALLFFLIAQLVSVIGSEDFGTSALEFARIASPVVMFVVLDHMLVDREHRKRVLLAVYASAIVPLGVALLGALQGKQLAEEKGDFSRVTSVFNQSNGFSRYLMLLIVMGVALYRHVPGRRLQVALTVLLAGSTVCLVLTYTRSAWLATIAGLLVVGWLQSKALVVGVFVCGAILLLAVPSVSMRLSDLDSDREVTGDPGNSLVWRFDYWTEVLPLANENPISGIGLKMTRLSTDEAKQPHNDFVRAYVETGVVGLLAYVVLFVALLRTARRARRVAAPGIDRAIAVGFTGCLTAFMLVSAVANVISSVVILWYFIAFAAAANSVAWNVDERKAIAERLKTSAQSRTSPVAS